MGTLSISAVETRDLPAIGCASLMRQIGEITVLEELQPARMLEPSCLVGLRSRLERLQLIFDFLLC